MMLQVLELPNKADKVVDFAWEPKGTKFAMLHGDGPRPSFSLYNMKDLKTSARGVQCIGTQPGKHANAIHWSPQVQRSMCMSLCPKQPDCSASSLTDCNQLHCCYTQKKAVS